MCWNKETSITSFIVGTLINTAIVGSTNNESLISLCIIWEWILIMQFCEFLIWYDQSCGQINKIGTKLALFFNITQPIIAYLVLMYFSRAPSYGYEKIISTVLIFFYTLHIILNINLDKYNCLKPNGKTCNHLYFSWWKKISGLFFVITIATLTLLLLRPLNLSIFTTFYFLLSLFISLMFYNCGNASIWCWLVVTYPLLALLFTKYFP